MTPLTEPRTFPAASWLIRLLTLQIVAACVFFPAMGHADVRTFAASHTYTMGDNQSKDEARELCLLEAKRKIQEQAGVFVRSLTRTDRYELAEDQIESFSAAVLRMESMNESVALSGETLAITIDLVASVDTDEVDRLLAKHAASAPSLGEPMQQNSLGDTPPMTPAAPGSNLSPLSHDELTRAASQQITKGMPQEAVLALLGDPASTRVTSPYQCSRYGDVWVVFKDQAVLCSRTRLQQVDRLQGDCHCDGLLQTFVMR